MLDRLEVADHEINLSHHTRIPTILAARLQYKHMPAPAPQSGTLHVQDKRGQVGEKDIGKGVDAWCYPVSVLREVAI